MPHVSTRTVAQRDDWFGTSVPDPYRWLEDGDDPEVADWLQAQAAQTREYLDALPGRDAMAAALRRVIGLPRSGVPHRHGTQWFRTANDGTAQQDALLVSEKPFGPSRVLVDPNPVSPDASTALAAAVPSRDGRLVAYAYLHAGSDWRTWLVRDVASGDDLADEVRWSKFTRPVWLPDGSGFVYGRFDEPGGDQFVTSNRGQWLAVHRIGTRQDDDEVLLALPDEPDITFTPDLTDDGGHVVVLGSRGTEHDYRVWVGEPGGALRLLVPDADASWQLVGCDGDELIMVTDRDAPRGRIVALHTGTGAARELIAQTDDTVQDATIAGGRIVVHRMHDATSRLALHELDGTAVAEIALPALGTVTELAAREDDAVLHVGWTTFTDPPGVLAIDARDGTVHTAFAVDAVSHDLVTEQVWVTSAHGTRLPVFLTHRAGLSPADGPLPCWQFGYGGFRIPMTPEFEPTRFAFAQAGGVVAVACLRGGGEYGAQWHDAGRLARKQHVFDDAIATAEHLVATGWTDRAHLAATGRSNGGLLAGALLTQRPDLFAAVVPEVGVLDMLRFPDWTIGWAWISDYGDPRAGAEQFANLYAYSPLHRLRSDAGYPPVLVMTSDHDDRVVPAHSMKFAAALQAVSPDDAVALLRVEHAGGHKEGRSVDALVAERTDVLAFLGAHTGLSWS